MGSQFLTVKWGNSIIPYKGILVKRLPPRKESFTLLQPQKPVSSPEIDLTEGFAFSNIGRYHVQYTGQLLCLSKEEVDLYCQGNLTQYSQISHQKKVEREYEIFVEKVNCKNLKLEAADPLELAKSVKCLRNKKCTPQPNFVGARNDQIGVTSALHKELCSPKGYPKVIKAVEENHLLYMHWFGSQTCMKRVKKVYQDCLKNLQDKTVTYNFTDPRKKCNSETPSTVVAYTSRGSDTVCLCPLYDDLPKYSDVDTADSKQQTLVHEWSHAFSNTKDYEYSQESCQDLAKESPDKAANNADNYGYFFCDAFNET